MAAHVSVSGAKQLNIAASTPSDENVITHELQKAKALANGQVVALYSNGDLFLYRILGGDDSKRLLLMKNVDSFEAFYEDENNTWVKSCDAEGRKGTVLQNRFYAKRNRVRLARLKTSCRASVFIE